MLFVVWEESQRERVLVLPANDFHAANDSHLKRRGLPGKNSADFDSKYFLFLLALNHDSGFATSHSIIIAFLSALLVLDLGLDRLIIDHCLKLCEEG